MSTYHQPKPPVTAFEPPEHTGRVTERTLLAGDGKGGWESSVKLNSGQLAEAVKPGNLLDASVFYQTEIGQPGLPWSGGQLMLEQNPEVSPIIARGLGADPGLWQSYADHPLVAASLQRPVAVLKEAERRLVPAELPPWSDAEDKAAHARQTEFCQRTWQIWAENGAERGLNEFINDVMITTPISGFSWFELTGQMQPMTIGGTQRPVLVPDIPHYRAPWAVSEWILQREKLIAVCGTFLQSQSQGYAPGPWNVVIPAHKVLHISARGVGSDLEGKSWMRAAWRMIQSLEQTLRIDALAVEINGMGTWVINEPDPTVSGGQATEAQRQAIADHLSNYEAGHMPWMMLPAGWTAQLLSPGSMLPDMVPRIAALERIIMLSMNSAHQLIATQKAGGSFAARSSAEREATAGWGMVAQEYIEKPLQKLLRRFIEFNFPADALAGRIFTPKVSHGAVDDAARMERVTLLTEAHKSGVFDSAQVGALVKRLLKVDDEDSIPHTVEATNGNQTKEDEENESVAREAGQQQSAGSDLKASAGAIRVEHRANGQAVV